MVWRVQARRWTGVPKKKKKKTQALESYVWTRSLVFSSFFFGGELRFFLPFAFSTSQNMRIIYLSFFFPYATQCWKKKNPNLYNLLRKFSYKFGCILRLQFHSIFFLLEAIIFSSYIFILAKFQENNCGGVKPRPTIEAQVHRFIKSTPEEEKSLRHHVGNTGA